ADPLDQGRLRERGGDLGRQALGVEVADPPHARHARERGLPERVEIEPDRRDDAQAGHDDAPASADVRRGASSHHPPSGPGLEYPAPPRSPGRTPRPRPPRESRASLPASARGPPRAPARRRASCARRQSRGGVAGEDVEPPGDAPDLRHQPLDLGGLLQVGRNEVGHAAAQLDVTRRARSGLAVDEEAHEDARAGLGEAERDGAPDPAPASRDQDLALRAHGAAPRAASSSGDRWRSRASPPSRAALAAASVPGCVASSAYSSVAVATRRPSTSAVAAITDGSADE